MDYFKRSTTITTQTGAIESLFGITRSKSGEVVSANTVFALPAFYKGIRLISSKIASARLAVFRETAEGARILDAKHPAHKLFNLKVNPYMDRFTFIQTLVANALWSGDGYALIQRDDMYNPINLTVLDSRTTFPFQEFNDQGELIKTWYKLEGKDNLIVVPAEDMIHIKNISLHTGLSGVSVVDQFKTVLGLALAVTSYGAVYFKNGAHLQRIIKIPAWLDEEQKQEIAAQIQARYSGIDNAHKTMVLSPGVELESQPINNEQAQWLESRFASLIDIANILCIPATLLGARDAISYGSVSEDNKSFLSQCLDPWMCSIETELSVKLLRQREGMKEIAFDRDSLFKGDAAYTQNLLQLFQGKAIAWEELREKLDLPSDTSGLTFGKVPGEEPPPQLQPQAQPGQQPQDQQPGQPQDQGGRPPVTDQARTVQRARKLTLSSLERIKKRLVKSSESDLSKHEKIIRSQFEDDADTILADLEKFQEELDNVLPEQRGDVYKKWDIHRLTDNLWREDE